MIANLGFYQSNFMNQFPQFSKSLLPYKTFVEENMKSKKIYDLPWVNQGAIVERDGEGKAENEHSHPP